MDIKNCIDTLIKRKESTEVINTIIRLNNKYEDLKEENTINKWWCNLLLGNLRDKYLSIAPEYRKLFLLANRYGFLKQKHNDIWRFIERAEIILDDIKGVIELANTFCVSNDGVENLNKPFDYNLKEYSPIIDLSAFDERRIHLYPTLIACCELIQDFSTFEKGIPEKVDLAMWVSPLNEYNENEIAHYFRTLFTKCKMAAMEDELQNVVEI